MGSQIVKRCSPVWASCPLLIAWMGSGRRRQSFARLWWIESLVQTEGAFEVLQAGYFDVQPFVL